MAHIKTKHFSSSSPSERLFSKAGQIESSQRAQLKPEQANMLIFLAKTCSEKIPKYRYYRYFFDISISVFFQYRNSLVSREVGTDNCT